MKFCRQSAAVPDYESPPSRGAWIEIPRVGGKG